MKTKNRAIAIVLGTLFTASLALSAAACNEEETQTTTHEHAYTLLYSVAADCENDGMEYYKCSGCGNIRTVKTDALGHDWDDSSVSLRYVMPCKRAGCNGGKLGENNHTYDEDLEYTFSEEDEEAVQAAYDAMVADLEAIGDYDGETYEVPSALYDKFLNFCEYLSTFDDYRTQAYYQNYNAYLEYCCDTSDETATYNYSHIVDYLSTLSSQRHAIEVLISKSKYKPYYFLDFTDDEITSALAADESALSGNTYSTENTAILTQYYAIEDRSTSAEVNTLYAQFVEKNTKMAQAYGYDNYLGYAYETIYQRDYTSADTASVAALVKKYISPYCADLTAAYRKLYKAASADTLTEFINIADGSVFSTVAANYSVNSFLNLISTYGTINFAQIFEDLFSDGNYFVTSYDGAFTNSIPTISHPIILFGDENYRSPTTVVHEFGHYVYELYNYDIINDGTIDPSYDLLETHSHGLEYLYYYYLRSYMSPDAYDLMQLYKFYVGARNIARFMAVNVFEQAVYTGEYTGTNAATIMADGKVTSDEYDLLFSSICSDFGVTDSDTYWRYVVISQPAYYITYSVTFLTGMQFFLLAEDESLSTAVEKYTKLITYTDEHPEYTYRQVFENAGLRTFADETLYQDLEKAFQSLLED
jgi:hypothetical protein